MAGENLEYDLSLSEQFTHRPTSSDTEALPSHPHQQQQHHHHHSKPNIHHTSSNSALTQQQPPHNHHTLPQQQQQPPHNHHALPLTFPATSTSVLPQRHQQQQQHTLPLPPSLPHHHASRHSLEAAGQMVSFDEKMKNWFDRDSAIGNSVESREVESTELDTDDEAEELR